MKRYLSDQKGTNPLIKMGSSIERKRKRRFPGGLENSGKKGEGAILLAEGTPRGLSFRKKGKMGGGEDVEIKW